jgi:TonB family protein
MKLHFVSLLLTTALLSCFSISAQPILEAMDTLPAPQPHNQEVTDEVLVFVEQRPLFPGNETALIRYLEDSIRYPVSMPLELTKSSAVVRFVVEKDGKITNIEVVRPISNCAECNTEAIRLATAMPAWTPGMQDGRAVRVRQTIPVSFIKKEKEKSSSAPAEIHNAMSIERLDSLPFPSPPKRTLPNDVFYIVEEMPEFPGGQAALFKYLQSSLKYPAAARKQKIEGTVMVNFFIETDGTVSNVAITRGLPEGGAGINEESLRVVKAMPAWKPGRQQGKPVRVSQNLPIRFKL